MCTLSAADYDCFETEEIYDEDTIRSRAVDAVNVSDANSVCKKCGSEDVRVSFRNKNKYCKSCFLNISTHKFRATLGKSKLVRPNDSVLIAHSGKANSTALVHLVTADANESIAKKPRFRYKVLYIDDGMVKGRTVEERESLRNAFAAEAESLRSPTYIVSLSQSTTDIISGEIRSINTSPISISPEDTALQASFDNLETDTARDELLRQLRRKLLVTVARKFNCDKVFVADTSVDLAIKVLGDLSTGRGSRLSSDVAFSDTRHAGTVLLRPLRDFTGDDLNWYLECCGLYPILTCKKYDLFFPASIRSIAKSFVHRLDSESYGTVSTIYRTSEKLAIRIKELARADISVDSDVDNSCIICELPIDSPCCREEQLSVVQAKSFSEQASTIGDARSDSCERSSDGIVEAMNTLTTQGCQCPAYSCNTLQRQKVVEKQLCYSCGLIFLDSKGTNNGLPTFVLDAIQRKLHLANLRNEIVNFLL